MSWKNYDGTVTGTQITGDLDVPSTGNWLQHLWLLLFVWKTIQVFHVPIEIAEAGYRIGFVPSQGQPQMMSKIVYHPYFRVRIGHEGCTFFAINADGNEIELIPSQRTTKKDRRFSHIKLY
jgi:hypothetical protein